MANSPNYVPALGFRALTRFYDPLIRWGLGEASWKVRLVEQVAPRPDDRILDVGCGTGTLALMLKRTCPGAEVVGLDGDPEILRRAEAKGALAGVGIELVHGHAGRALPFESGRFDKIVSSLVFHHLATETKRAALKECFRLLRSGGELHIADWAPPHNALFFIVRLLDGIALTRDVVEGRLPALMRESGFMEVTQRHRRATMLGTLAFHSARKP